MNYYHRRRHVIICVQSMGVVVTAIMQLLNSAHRTAMLVDPGFPVAFAVFACERCLDRPGWVLGRVVADTVMLSYRDNLA